MDLHAAAQTRCPRDAGHGAFHSTTQVLAGDVAMLEFETTVDGKYVNWIDIIRCDDTGRIVEFRVMIRPLHRCTRRCTRMKGEKDAVRDPAAQHP